MYLANASQVAIFTGGKAYANGAMHDADGAKINRIVIEQTGGKLPCYAARIGKRGAIVWVSVGSSARISRKEAKAWLSRVGADLESIEYWWDFTLDDSARVA